MLLHADAVAQNRAAGIRAAWDRPRSRHRLALFANMRDQLIAERALSRPGRPVTPRISARPVCGNSSRSSGSASGRRFSIHVAARASARRSPLEDFLRERSVRIMRQLFSKLPRDHQPLDFAGAFTDGAQLHVAIKFLHRIVFDEAIAAVDLHRFVGDAHGDLGGDTAWPSPIPC